MITGWTKKVPTEPGEYRIWNGDAGSKAFVAELGFPSGSTKAEMVAWVPGREEGYSLSSDFPGAWYRRIAEDHPMKVGQNNRPSADRVLMNLTLPALERLIGGDTEMELGLRRGICTEFGNRYLGTLFNEEVTKSLNELRSEIKAAANVAICDALRCGDVVPTSAGKFVYLDAALVRGIRERITQETQQIVKVEVQDAVVKADVHGIVARAVDARLGRLATMSIRDEINKLVLEALPKMFDKA